MIRHSSVAFVAFLATVPFSLGQNPPQTKPRDEFSNPAGNRDAHGDPLPDAALARLGTSRFHHRNLNLACLSPDGKTLVLQKRDGLLGMDVETGKITQWSKANLQTGNRAVFC